MQNHASLTPCADAFAFARMGDTLTPAIPSTLREHVAARPFAAFGVALFAERPPATDLSDRVARLRVREKAAPTIVRGTDFVKRPTPLQPHPDQMIDGRGLRLGLKVTTLLLTSWIAFGIGVAIKTGRI